MAKCAPGKSCTETRQTIRRPDYIPLPVSLSLSLYLSLSSSHCSICLKFHLLHITALAECTYRTYTTPPHTNTITDTNTSTNTINEVTLIPTITEIDAVTVNCNFYAKNLQRAQHGQSKKITAGSKRLRNDYRRIQQRI